MKTQKGAFRYVMFGEKRVYKFAATRYFFGVIKSAPHMLFNGDGFFIFKELAWGFRNFIRGISENWTEYRSWRRLRTPFLIPTTFSCGLMNIQIRAMGEAPSREELEALFLQLPLPAQRELRELEAHCIEPANFVKTKDGIKLVDYDNGTTDTALKHPFGVFLERWHSDLEKIFIPKIS